MDISWQQKWPCDLRFNFISLCVYMYVCHEMPWKLADHYTHFNDVTTRFLEFLWFFLKHEIISLQKVQHQYHKGWNFRGFVILHFLKKVSKIEVASHHPSGSTVTIFF